MAYIDKIKEEIGWLKVVFAILIAWLIQNYGKMNLFLYLAGTLAAFLIMFIIDRIDRAARQKMNELEEL